MIIYSKQAFTLTNKNGEKYHADNGFIGCPPEWVEHDDFFKALCEAGLVTAHIDNKSVDVAVAKDEQSKKNNKK
jgi:hypothetical protein